MAFNPIEHLNLKLISWNANGLSNQHYEFVNFVTCNNPDLILIQETLIKTTIPFLPGYEYYANNQGRGTIIYYKDSLEVEQIFILNLPFEYVCVKLADIIIANVYISQNSNINELSKIFNVNNKCIIAGDFNSRHISWNCFSNNTNGNKLVSFLNANPLLQLQHPDTPTRYPTNDVRPSTIDLFMTKNVSVAKPVTLDELNSDHLPVVTTYNTTAINHKTPFRIPKTNWKLYRTKLNKNLNFKANYNSKEEIKLETDLFIKAINDAYNSSTNYSKSNYNLKLTDEIKNLIREKNRIRKILRRNPDPNLKIQFNSLKNEIKKQISNLKQEKFDKFIKNSTKNHHKLFWKTVKKMKNPSGITQIPPLHSKHGLKYSNTDKAEAIAETLQDKHLTTTNFSSYDTETLINNTVNDYCNTKIETPDIDLPTLGEIKKIIYSLPVNKTPGNDKITNLHIKNFTNKAINHLLQLFKACLKLQYFPHQFKTASIVPLLKPGKNPTMPQSYRPISLLPTLGKILEKLILRRLNKFLSLKNIIIPEQFGFRSQHSTELQLFRITSKITENFNSDKVSALLSLDIESAFDTVWLKALIFKLIKLEIPGYIIKLINSYIFKRDYQVKIKKNHSNKFKIPAGVPQGGILSPILFLLFINDIPNDPKIMLSLFADDTALLATSYNKTQADKYLQNSIQNLEKYYDKWKIKINGDKTKLIYFSKKKKYTDTTLTMNNVKIGVTENLKYLGVTLDPKLNFSSHIGEKTRNIKSAARNLYPILSNSKLNVKSKLMLYKTGLRPIITYACPIWSCIALSRLRQLDPIQNNIIRTILNKRRSYPVKKLNKEANVLMLSERITEQALKFFNNSAKRHQLTRSILSTDYDFPPRKRRSHRLTHHLYIETK